MQRWKTSKDFQMKLIENLCYMNFQKRFSLMIMTACKGFVISILIFQIDMRHGRENMLKVINCHLLHKISQKHNEKIKTGQ